MWAAGAGCVLAALLGIGGLAAFNDFWNTRPGSFAEGVAARNVDDADFAIYASVLLLGLIGFVVGVLLIIWSYQAHRASRSLSDGPRAWSSGWSVGAWFIPLANLVLPKLVLNEIERIALAPRDETGKMGDWRGRSTIPIGWFWWILYIVGYFVALFGYSTFDSIDGTEGSWRAGYVAVVAGFSMLAGSSVFGALYIRRITKALNG